MKKFLKGLLIGLGSIVILGAAFGAYYKLNLPEIITQSIMVTSDGTSTGNLIFWANTGGKNISYGQLLDSGANAFLTGGALSPYVLISSTGNWNTAFSRGDHSVAGYLTGSALTPYVLLSQTGDRNTAFSRGNHAVAGYLTGYTETDPIRSAASGNYVDMSMTGNRNTVYGRGNHASVGYITGYIETDPVRSAASSNYLTTGLINVLSNSYLPYQSGGALFDSTIFLGNLGNIGIKNVDPQWTLDVSGTIQSNVSFNLTGGFAPFRLVYSGNAVVPQLLSGLDRVAALYTGGEFVLP